MLTPADARAIVHTGLLRIVPDADLDDLGPDEDVRDALELDSLDLLGFVELVSERSGVRIDEDDYPRVVTVDGCVRLLVERSTG